MRYSKATLNELEQVHDGIKKVFKYRQKLLTTSKWVILSGGVGTGKTHTVMALANELGADGTTFVEEHTDSMGRFVASHYKAIKGKSHRFITWDSFNQSCNEVSMNGKNKSKYIRSLIANDITILDDLTLRNITEAKMENFYILINEAYNLNRRLFITTNMTREDFRKLDDRIVSRLQEMAFMVEFNGEDYRVKKAKE